MLSSRYRFKFVRCPLYGFIGLSNRENRLLNTIAMQRLSRIKQLSHTYVVYPSAVHTRFEHSLGTLHLADRVCDQLDFSKKERTVVRIAALLHDVGQGPFSHVWDEPMRWINGEDYRHEDVTRLIIEFDTEIGRALGNLRSKVLEVFTEDTLSSDVISGNLDVDKMDYLRRDSFHTGVAYGLFDLERIIRTLCRVSEVGRDYLAVLEKGKDALESYRLARHAMHMQVYGHHARIIADDMFTKAIKFALREGCLTEEDLRISDDPTAFISRFLKLDDFSIQHKILETSTGVAKDLIQDIRNRKLLKRAFKVPLTKECVNNALLRKKLARMNGDDLENAEQEIATEIGIDSAYVVVHLQSIEIKLYESFEQTLRKKDKDIFVVGKGGEISLLEEESPISASHDPVRRLYVFCPEKYTKKAREIAEDKFKVKSVL